MAHPNAELRPTHFLDGAWQVPLADGACRPVLQKDGHPATLLPGWRAKSCVDFASKFYLLLLFHDSGTTAIWVLDADLRFVSDQADFTAMLSAETHRGLSVAAARFLAEVRCNPLRRSTEPAWTALRGMGDATLAIFTAFADTPPRVLSLDEATSLALTTDRGSTSVPLSALQQIVSLARPHLDQRKHPWLAPAARTGRIQVPGLTQPGFSDAVYLVGRWYVNPAYLCIENELGLRYYIFQLIGFPTLVYFPNDNLLISEQKLDGSPAAAREALRQLDSQLLSLAGCNIESAPAETVTVGLFTFGLLNFGHAIWEEMTALDVFLDELSPGAGPALLYLPSGASGVDLYGPVEELYPEFSGHVVRAPSEAAAFSAAIQAGVSLVLRSGLTVLHATRDRIARVVKSHADDNRLPRRVQQALGKPGRERLVVTLGLRLTNRCPVDVLGLYARLTRALSDRFGPLVIVIDGINGGDAPNKAAAHVFNGVRRAGASFVESMRDGSAELREELDWVTQYSYAVRHDNVDVVSCVGRPIRENLYWLSQSDFFVAPFGGGIAKLRWALDIPGFVLISRTNLDHCDLLHIYDDKRDMENPFSPLFFNGPEDVTDVELDPPRTEPAAAHFIPHPEDFIVDEDAVIPKICDLMAMHVSRAGSKGSGDFGGVWQRLRRAVWRREAAR